MGDILLSKTTCSSPIRPSFEGTLLLHHQTLTLLVLIESRADESFLDRHVALQLGLETQPLDTIGSKGTQHNPCTGFGEDFPGPSTPFR